MKRAQENDSWPWCTACRSYHHPFNPTCYAKPGGKLAKLRWAEVELLRVRDNITSTIAPQSAKKIRSALKSLEGAIRHQERMERQEPETRTGARKS